MKVAANIFWVIGLFFVAAGTLYGFWIEWTEWAGIPALYALSAMSWMIAWYLRAAEHKYGVGPADDEDGQIVEYAGTYGTFAPWSWWPLGLGLGGLIGAVFVLGQVVLGHDLGVQGLGLAQLVGILGRIRRAVITLALGQQHFGHGIFRRRLRAGLALALGVGGAGRQREGQGRGQHQRRQGTDGSDLRGQGAGHGALLAGGIRRTASLALSASKGNNVSRGVRLPCGVLQRQQKLETRALRPGVQQRQGAAVIGRQLA